MNPSAGHRTDRLRMDDSPGTAAGRDPLPDTGALPRPHYLSVKLETGRTHQIRLHLSHLRYPIAGDQVYGGRFAQPKGATSPRLLATLRSFKRQALHAANWRSIIREGER